MPSYLNCMTTAKIEWTTPGGIILYYPGYLNLVLHILIFYTNKQTNGSCGGSVAVSAVFYTVAKETIYDTNSHLWSIMVRLFHYL